MMQGRFVDMSDKELRKVVRKVQLDILIKLDEVCKKNNLRYYLAFGTCLGALRHKGFIPWDDDIDISLPRPDYEKFVRTFHADGLRCVAPEIGNSYMTFGRVVDEERTTCVPFLPWDRPGGEGLGVWIDVFPMDGEPDDMEEFTKLVDEFVSLNDDNRFARERVQLKPSKKFSLKHNIGIIAKEILLSYKTPQFVWRKMIKLVKKIPYGSTKYAGLLVFPFYKVKDRTRTEVFESYTRAQFEDGEFSIISGYDEYLTNIYGDYMKLPPEEKRVPAHSLHKFYYREGI